MPYPYDPVKLKAWNADLDRHYTANPQPWHQHDTAIMNTVSDYNTWLRGKAGFSGLDWVMVKAQAWVETGANLPDWNNNVLQIGINGDPGLHDLLTKPNAQLVIPP